MSVEVAHGVDGWELEDYTWGENGVGTYWYSRTVRGVLEETSVVKNQPYLPGHPGWRAN